MLKASEATGIAVEELSKLKFAAAMSGASFEDLETGIRKMQKTIGEASSSSAEAQHALGLLGLTVGDLKNLTPEDQFKRMATGVAGIGNAADRTTAIMANFGRGGTALAELLRKGADGMNALGQQAEKLGLVMSKETAESLSKLNKDMILLGAVSKSVFGALAGAVVPALTEFVEWLIPAIIKVRDFVRENKTFIAMAFKAGAALMAFGFAVSIAGKIISLAGSAVGLIKFGLAALSVASKLAILPFLLLKGVVLGFVFVLFVAKAGLLALFSPMVLISAAVLGIGAAFFIATGEGKRAATVWGASWSGIKDTAVTAWGGIVDAIKAGDLGLAGQIGMLGLKLVWLNVVAALADTWTGFTNFFANAWNAVGGAFRMIANNMLAYLQSEWPATMEFIGKAWEAFGNVVTTVWGWIKTGWSATIDFMSKIWVKFVSLIKKVGSIFAKIWAKITGKEEKKEEEPVTAEEADKRKKQIDFETAIEKESLDKEAIVRKGQVGKGTIDKDDKDITPAETQRRKDAIDAAIKRRKEAAEEKAQRQKDALDKAAGGGLVDKDEEKRKAGIEENRVAKNKGIVDEFAAGKAARQKERDDDLAEKRAGIEEEMKRLMGLAAEAKKKRQEKEDEAAKAGDGKEPPGTTPLGGAPAAGTFSAAALGSLGGSGMTRLIQIQEAALVEQKNVIGALKQAGLILG